MNIVSLNSSCLIEKFHNNDDIVFCVGDICMTCCKFLVLVHKYLGKHLKGYIGYLMGRWGYDT